MAVPAERSKLRIFTARSLRHAESVSHPAPISCPIKLESEEAKDFNQDTRQNPASLFAQAQSVLSNQSQISDDLLKNLFEKLINSATVPQHVLLENDINKNLELLLKSFNDKPLLEDGSIASDNATLDKIEYLRLFLEKHYLLESSPSLICFSQWLKATELSLKFSYLFWNKLVSYAQPDDEEHYLTQLEILFHKGVTLKKFLMGAQDKFDSLIEKYLKEYQDFIEHLTRIAEKYESDLQQNFFSIMKSSILSEASQIEKQKIPENIKDEHTYNSIRNFFKKQSLIIEKNIIPLSSERISLLLGNDITSNTCSNTRSALLHPAQKDFPILRMIQIPEIDPVFLKLDHCGIKILYYLYEIENEKFHLYVCHKDETGYRILYGFYCHFPKHPTLTEYVTVISWWYFKDKVTNKILTGDIFKRQKILIPNLGIDNLRSNALLLLNDTIKKTWIKFLQSNTNSQIASPMTKIITSWDQLSKILETLFIFFSRIYKCPELVPSKDQNLLKNSHTIKSLIEKPGILEEYEFFKKTTERDKNNNEIITIHLLLGSKTFNLLFILHQSKEKMEQHYKKIKSLKESNTLFSSIELILQELNNFIEAQRSKSARSKNSNSNSNVSEAENLVRSDPSLLSSELKSSEEREKLLLDALMKQNELLEKYGLPTTPIPSLTPKFNRSVSNTPRHDRSLSLSQEYQNSRSYNSSPASARMAPSTPTPKSPATAH